MHIFSLVPLLLVMFFIFAGCSSTEDSKDDLSHKVDFTNSVILGKALFQDKDLSFARSMSCASCHSLDRAMTDDREEATIGASLGDDENSLGDRNAPMVTYASFSPKFTSIKNIAFRGGQFWDGRAMDLVEQAKGPFLNEIEMQMPDVSSVVARVMEKESYITALEKFYGEDVFDTDEQAFEAVAQAIADYESSPEVSTFDSKFDKSEKGEILSTDLERRGESLFVSSGCSACHTFRSVDKTPPLFTSYAYQNIGVPKNSALRLINGVSSTYIDKGLANREEYNETYQEGLFKIPSLRNVAVTAPYTHNGVFKTLKTMVHFYNTRDVVGAINPDTDMPWEPSEVMQNRFNGIGDLKLSSQDEDAIIAFLKTLTDARYEALLK